MAAIIPDQHRSEDSSQTLTILVPFQVVIGYMFCLYLVKHWFGNSFCIDCCVPSVTVKSSRHGSKTCVGLIAKSPIFAKNTSRPL